MRRRIISVMRPQRAQASQFSKGAGTARGHRQETTAEDSHCRGEIPTEI